MLVCSCAKKKNKDMYLGHELQQLRKVTQFQASEILEIRSRFYKLTNGEGFMQINSFREMMGLGGGGQDSQARELSERIYRVLDKDRDGKVSFREYISHLNTMIHGDQQSKNDYTFTLIDIEHKGTFDRTAFSNLMKLFVGLWINVTGNAIDPQAQMKLDQHISNIYDKIDTDKTGRVDKGMFQHAIQKDPNLLEIFDFIGKGMHENVGVLDDGQKRNVFKFAKEVFKIEISIQSTPISYS